MEDLFQLIIDVIVFPTANGKQIHPLARLFCFIILVLIFFVPGILCFIVGFSMLGEGESKGYLLLLIGCGCSTYPILETRGAYRKRNSLK